MKLLGLLSLFFGLVAATGSSIETRDAPIGMRSHPVNYCKVTNYIFEGTLIHGCQNPGTIALTFDDGPSQYTPQLLDTLARYGAKATFFIVGSGWRGNIDNW